MSLSNARGVCVIAPTPFLDDGRVDVDSVDRMTDFFLGSGVAGITVLGQMGEAPKLEQREALEVAQRVGLCAIGRATNQRFLCFSHPQRLVRDVVPTVRPQPYTSSM
jgi:dihydrodipicolinate synthase/N-acetylneuraminate lyase